MKLDSDTLLELLRLVLRQKGGLELAPPMPELDPLMKGVLSEDLPTDEPQGD